MKLFHTALTIALLASASLPALARTHTPTLQDRQQAACYPDVQRLCGEFIPDVAKVTACMKDKQSQVGPKCAAFYKKR